MECPRCSSEMTDGRCPTCGYTVPTKRKESTDIKSKIKGVVTSIAFILFVGYLIFITGLLIFSIDLVLPETLVNETTIFILIPFGLGIAEISGYTFAVYYLFLVGGILLSYAAIFYMGWEDIVSYFKNIFKGKFKKLNDEKKATSSPLLRLVTVFTALLFISYVYIMILELTGRGIQTPEEFFNRPLWENIFSLTQAAVWEEIVVRLIYIGLPMLIYALVVGKRNFKKYLLGGFGFKERFSVTLVIVSTIIFAVAHLPGWNWDPFKVIQVLPAGIFFGYLFVKDGLHSAILLHFIWDFMSAPDMLMDIPNFNTFFPVLLLFWMAVGVYYTYEYILKFIRWGKGDRAEEEQEVSPEEEKKVDHTAGITIGYSCPNCGYTTAEYTEKDELRCKRCGTTSDPKSPRSQQEKNLLQGGGWPPS